MTYEEFSSGQPTRTLGMSAEQFAGGGELTTDPNNTAALLGRLSSFQQQAEEAKSASDWANSPRGIAQETAKGTINTLLTPAVKFTKSAFAAPIDLVRSLLGKQPINMGGNDIYGKPITTIQQDAAQATSDVYEGKKSPLLATGEITGETVAGAADVLGAGEGLSKAVSKGSKLVAPIVEKGLAKQSSKEALDVVTPKLTAKETESALASGRGKGGGLFSKTKISPDVKTQRAAKAVEGLVSKGKSGAENIRSIRQGIETEAESLKTQIKGADHPYTFKELNSKISNAEEPISLKGTPFEKQIKPLKDAVMKIAKQNKGNISGLLDTRKDFDALVEKTWPNIFEKENAPMRNAVTAIRNAINDFIESNLPDDIKFKDSLHKQSSMYDAIDNIAGKSVEETKMTGLERLGKTVRKHPVGALLTGAGAAEVTRKAVTGNF